MVKYLRLIHLPRFHDGKQLMVKYDANRIVEPI